MSIARLVAFYLPQYHPIPENDEWWGPGFTEWTNVSSARPLFRGHVQPNLPGELGFYDLRLPETRLAQAMLARNCGIEGFAYWHYWFAGKRLLERPFVEVLSSGKPDFPFCLAWANQSWTGVWHGCPHRILIEQTYPGYDDFVAHFQSLVPAFFDSRYIRVDGKPLFLVQCPDAIPDAKGFARLWRGLAQDAGLDGLFLVGLHHDVWDPQDNGFDGWIREPAIKGSAHIPQKIRNECVRRVQALAVRTSFLQRPIVFRYAEKVNDAVTMENLTADQFPVVVPNWDNTPRNGPRGIVWSGGSPDLFGMWLSDAVRRVANRSRDQRLVFIKSWNEWAEGNYLEPDRRSGRAYLNMVRQVMSIDCPPT